MVDDAEGLRGLERTLESCSGEPGRVGIRRGKDRILLSEFAAISKRHIGIKLEICMKVTTARAVTYAKEWK